MARSFASASSQYLETTSLPVTAAPFTMACWFKPVSATVKYSLMSIGDAGVSNVYFSLESNTAGNILASTNAVAATTSTTFSAGNWHHACAVFASATDRRAFLNGGGKGTNTTSRTPSSLDRFGIGVLDVSVRSAFMNGDIAEAAIWNVALSDADVADLAKGISPLMLRKEALVFYAPLHGRASPEPDFKGARNLTLAASPTQGAHPRIFYPIGGAIVPKGTPVTGYTLSVDAATFTLTGNAATLTAGRKLTAATGSFSLTGNATGLLRGYPLIAATGAFSLTGNAANLMRGYRLNATTASFALTGNGAGLLHGRRLTADAAAFAHTGNDVTFPRSYALLATTSTFALSGNAAGLEYGRRMAAEAVELVLTGNDADLIYTPAGAYTFDAEPGAFSLAGNSADLTYNPEQSGSGYLYPSRRDDPKRETPQAVIEDDRIDREAAEIEGNQPPALDEAQRLAAITALRRELADASAAAANRAQRERLTAARRELNRLQREQTAAKNRARREEEDAFMMLLAA